MANIWIMPRLTKLIPAPLQVSASIAILVIADRHGNVPRVGIWASIEWLPRYVSTMPLATGFGLYAHALAPFQTLRPLYIIFCPSCRYFSRRSALLNHLLDVEAWSAIYDPTRGGCQVRNVSHKVWPEYRDRLLWRYGRFGADRAQSMINVQTSGRGAHRDCRGSLPPRWVPC